MKSVHYDAPVEVSGHAIEVVSLIHASGYEGRGFFAFLGEKRPVAVVCRSAKGERIVGLDGREMDRASLQDLVGDEAFRT